MIFLEFYGTIGPACAQLETLQRMVKAGMTGIRMNLSHGALAEHADWLAMIHAVGIPDLLIDLQGPELRVGRLTSPVTLPEGGTVQLGAGGIPCPVQLVQAARPGQLLLLDEHTAALDPKTAAKVLALTEKIIAEHHLTAMMVTHNMKDAIRLGNRLIMMHEGRIIYDVAGEEKKNLQVSDLLAKFEQASGGEFANDRMMLA
mgnify:CR=1 FL=1